MIKNITVSIFMLIVLFYITNVQIAHAQDNIVDVPESIPIDQIFITPPGSNSYVVGNNVVVTDKKTSQIGSIFSSEQNKIDLTKDFYSEMYINIDGDADGICFVMHNDPNKLSEFSGVLGGGLGVYGDKVYMGAPAKVGDLQIKNSFSVEFDTYNNSDLYDSGIDGNNGYGHIAYSFPDIPDSYSFNWTTRKITGVQHRGIQYPNFKLGDGKWRLFKIKWDSWDENNMGKLTYTFDTLPPVSVPISNTVFGVNEVYWGFTGSTGMYYEKAIVAFKSVPGLVNYDDNIEFMDSNGNNIKSINNNSEVTVHYNGQYKGGKQDLFKPTLKFKLAQNQVYQPNSFSLNGNVVNPSYENDELVFSLPDDLSQKNSTVDIQFKVKDRNIVGNTELTMSSVLTGTNYILEKNASYNVEYKLKGDSKLRYTLYGNGLISDNELFYNSEEKKIGFNVDINNAISNTSSLIWHKNFSGQNYYTFELIRNGKVIKIYEANGNDSIQDLYKFLGESNGMEISYGDIIHSRIAEYRQEFITNNPSSAVSAYTLGTDAYFKLTNKGMINLSNAINLKDYSDININNYISLNPGHPTYPKTAAISTFSDSGDSLIQKEFPDTEYYNITEYNVTQNNLNNISAINNGVGINTYQDFLSRFKDFQSNYGKVYKIFKKEPEKVEIYHNGEIKYKGSNDLSLTDYFEFTEKEGLNKLNFVKVTGKTKQIELNSDISNITAADEFTDANLYSDIEVLSFKNKLENNKLGTYTMPINLKQKLNTSGNYINFNVDSKIIIVDTTAPTADPVPQELYQGENFDGDPLSLITNLKDNDAVENITAKIIEMPNTSKIGTTNSKVEISDKSGNTSVITIPFTIKSRDANLSVLFVNENNKILSGYSVTIKTQIGNIVDLTKNEVVQKQLKNIISAGYDVIENPTNENKILIDHTNVTIQYKVKGTLSITSFPNILDFGTLKYNATTQRIERPSFDNRLEVTDSRIDNTNGWIMTASLTTPMRNSDGKELVNALRYVKQGKETILNQTPQVIYSNKNNLGGSYIISNNWGNTANTDGIKLQINSSDKVYTGDYMGVITWKVIAGQP